MTNQASFAHLCEQLSTLFIELIQHPDCPERLRSHVIGYGYDLFNTSHADLRIERAVIEFRYLLPLYLADYGDSDDVQ